MKIRIRTVARVLLLDRPAPWRLVPYLRYMAQVDACSAPLGVWTGSCDYRERVRALAEIAEYCDVQARVFAKAFGRRPDVDADAEDCRRAGIFFRLLALAEERSLIRFYGGKVELDAELLDERLSAAAWLRPDDAEFVALIRPYLFWIAKLHEQARIDTEATEELATLLEDISADVAAFGDGHVQVRDDAGFLARLLREIMLPRLAWPSAPAA